MSKRPSKRHKKPGTGKHFTRTVLDEKNKFGSLPFDRLIPPGVGIHDEPTRCYRVNLEWAPVVTGMIALLAETRMWAGAWDESHPAIIEILKLLDGEDCDMIDCNDVEACLDASQTIIQIQQSIFEIDAVNYQQAKADADAHLDDLLVQYDGSAQSIGASIPVAAPTQAQADALCHTLFNIIRAYQAAKAHEIASTTLFEANLSILWQSVRRMFFETTTFQLFHVLSSDIFDCAPDFIQALLALSDDTQAEALTCCLKDELDGVAMTEANWNASVSTCASVNVLGCFFDADNSQRHYLSFLEAYNSVLVEQATNLNADITDCPCDWHEIFDFAVGDVRWGFSTQPETGCTEPTGVLTSSGWQGTYTNCSFGTPAYTVQIAPGASGLGGGNYIRKIVIEWMPASQNFVGVLANIQARDGGAVTFASGNVNQSADLAGRMSVYVTGVHDNFAFQFRSGVHSPEDSERQFTISRVILSGVGNNPWS